MNRMILVIFSFFTLILTVSAMNYNVRADNNVWRISDTNKSGSFSTLKQYVSLDNSCQKKCCYNKSK